MHISVTTSRSPKTTEPHVTQTLNLSPPAAVDAPNRHSLNSSVSLFLLAAAAGTGKTSTARVLAGRASLPLVYVPLESLVSKWYGESEQNMAKVGKTDHSTPQNHMPQHSTPQHITWAGLIVYGPFSDCSCV
jgi:hypothetical protein